MSIALYDGRALMALAVGSKVLVYRVEYVPNYLVTFKELGVVCNYEGAKYNPVVVVRGESGVVYKVPIFGYSVGEHTNFPLAFGPFKS